MDEPGSLTGVAAILDLVRLMEEPVVTPSFQTPPDPDIRALMAQHERDVEALDLAADLIAAELVLVALLIRLRFPLRLI